MSKLTSQLLDSARSLADLQNTDFVTYKDTQDALNEAYRDIYNQYTESQGDYFCKEVLIQMTSAYVVPDTFGYWYELPLPDDFYKVREVSYQAGGMWANVNSFAMSDRNTPSIIPQYRIKNNKLWILSANAWLIRLGYYIPPIELSSPDAPISFLSDREDYDISDVAYPSYVSAKDSMLYTEGTDIKAQSNTADGAIYTLLTATAPSAPVYYRGYVYYIEAGNIRRFTSDLKAANGTPATVVNTANVVALSVFNNRLYFDDGTNSRFANLDGTGSTIYGARGTAWCQLQDDIAYLSNAGVVLKGLVAVTGINANPVSIASDNVYLYVQHADYTLYRYTITGVVATDTKLMATGVARLYQYNVTDSAKRLQVTNNGTNTVSADITFTALSLIPDVLLDYPTTEVWELLSYGMAMFFVRKNSDTAKMGVLQPTIDKLWLRFLQTIDRDEYQAYRINDYYGQNSMPFPWGGLNG